MTSFSEGEDLPGRTQGGCIGERELPEEEGREERKRLGFQDRGKRRERHIIGLS